MPADETLDSLHAAFAEDGWTDAELTAYLDAILAQPDPQAHVESLWNAILDPQLPHEEHSDPKFYEVLAWYLDKSSSGPGDGRFGLQEAQQQLVTHGQRYLATAQQQGQDVARLQSWKFVQKLRLLEAEIAKRAQAGLGAYYPYSAHQMAQIDAEGWNAANTIHTRAEFDARVIAGSAQRPVLVKFGLTYCAHCLLLEQLGSVPAVAARYDGQIDVVKLWWNPHDSAMADITAVAVEQGVSSSPWFILYDGGGAVRSGYGFPDETGAGLEELLAGYVQG